MLHEYGAAEAGSRCGVAAARGECEGQREPPRERSGKDERGTDERERAERDEQAVVVEGLREHTPDGGEQRRAREVGEVVERNRSAGRARTARRALRVPPLESSVRVVTAVRCVSFPDERADELDLVRRVVDEPP